MEETRITIKEELNKCFTDDYIRNVGLLLHTFAEEFYHKNHLEENVYFNDDIFEYCLLDILVDLARLKTFHDIENVNFIKLMAYSASWCLKRKPFQLIEGADKKYIYINEKFALSLLMRAVGMLNDNNYCWKCNNQVLIKNISHWMYHLKYRNTNPQTLELFLIGFETGEMIYVQ